MDLSESKAEDLKKNGASTAQTPGHEDSFTDKIRKLIKFFTVEPFLVCYILPLMVSSLTVQKLNLEKACRVDLGHSEDVCFRVVTAEANDNITQAASEASQIALAQMTAWQQPIQSGIPALLILFIGAWSDKTGNRKALMLLPLSGEIISAIGLLLTTYFFLEWPLWATALIEALPSAFSGGISVAVMGCYSYLADVTTLEERTFRIGIIAVIATLAVPIGTSVSGILTETIGYYGVFSLVLVMYVFGYVYTFLRVHNVRNTKIEGSFLVKFLDFFHPKHVWETIAILFMSRGKRLAKMILVLLSYVLISGPVAGEANILFLYMIQKFQIDVVGLSYFATYLTLIGIVGTSIAVSLFSNKLGMHDALLGIIATTSKVCSSIVYAFAPNATWLYVAPVVDIFGSSATVAIKSLGTKIVNPDEVGKMCSLIGLVEALVPVIYAPMYTTIYSNTLTTFPGCVYLVGGLMTIPAFFTFIYIYVLHKKEVRDIVKNPEAKEAYSHDNAVTVL